MDLPKLLHTASTENTRRARRWRRAAVAGLAASVVLCLLTVSRLDVNIEKNGVAIYWGNANHTPAVRDDDFQQVTQEVQNCVAKLEQIQQRLGTTVRRMEQGQLKQNEIMVELARDLVDVRKRNDARWRTTDLVWRENQARLAAVHRTIIGLYQTLDESNSDW